MTRRQLSMTGSNNNSRRRREGRGSSRRSRSKCGKGAARQALKKVFALVYMKSKHTNKIYQEIYQKKDVNQKRSAAKNTQRAPAAAPATAAPGTALLQLKLLKIIARQSWLTACGRLWCLLFPSSPWPCPFHVPLQSLCLHRKRARCGDISIWFHFSLLAAGGGATGNWTRSKSAWQARKGSTLWRLSESPEREMLKRRRRWTLVSSFLPFYVCVLFSRHLFHFLSPSFVFPLSFLVLALLVVAVFLMMIEQRANLVASTLGLSEFLGRTECSGQGAWPGGTGG